LAAPLFETGNGPADKDFVDDRFLEAFSVKQTGADGLVAVMSWSACFNLRSACMLICLIWAFPQSAMAAAHESSVKKACEAEILSICVRPWRLTPDTISSCVEENRLKLSSTCQAVWATTYLCMQKVKEVCGGLNPLTINGCLKNSVHEFSSTCQRLLYDR
jgi:hypothetical protein